MRTRGKNNMLTTSGVANMLHIHINTVRRWSDQGILKPYRIGPRGDRRFLRDDVMYFLTTQNYGYKDQLSTRDTINSI
jgi:excisionase family DNA binding protein